MKPMMSQALEIGLAKHANQWERVIRFGYYMEPKLDGMRVLLDWDEDRIFRAYTRSGRDISGHLYHWAKQLPSLQNVTLDCELGYPTLNEPFVIDFNKTMRVLGSGPDVAEDKRLALLQDHGEELFAYVFDMPSCWNKRQFERNGELSELFERELGDTASVRKVPEIGLGHWDESIYAEFVDRGGEGIMLKSPDAYYKWGSRPTQTWYKVKAYETTDAVVVGTDPGKGKYEGQIGALIFELESGPVARCSGMSDAERLEMTHMGNDILGRWIEIRYFGGVGRDKDGLRHPQFIRFRDPK